MSLYTSDIVTLWYTLPRKTASWHSDEHSTFLWVTVSVLAAHYQLAHAGIHIIDTRCVLQEEMAAHHGQSLYHILLNLQTQVTQPGHKESGSGCVTCVWRFHNKWYKDWLQCAAISSWITCITETNWGGHLCVESIGLTWVTCSDGSPHFSCTFPRAGEMCTELSYS